MFRSIRFVGMVVSATLLGCAKLSPSQMALEQASLGGKIEQVSSRPTCEVQPTEYILDSKMIAFDVTTSGGLHAGFDLVSGFLKLLSLDFKASSGRMVIGMSLQDSISPKTELVNVMGSGRSVDFGAGVNIGFSQIGAGFSYDQKTPLTSLIESSLNDTFSALFYQVAARQQAWNTQVVAVPTRNEAVIPIGTYGNVQLGDQFAIYNIQHVWSGVPCESEHLMTRKTTSKPAAIGTVTQVVNNAALLTLAWTTDLATAQMLEQGARVEISKLPGRDRWLYRMIQIRNVGGAEIAYENAKKVDVSGSLRDHIKALARTYGFLVYNP
jgi:hypothetical protein